MTQSTLDYSAAAATFYSELDANAANVFEDRLTSDAVFVFNDYDAVSGRDSIATFIVDWKANFQSVTHQIIQTTVDLVKNTVGVEVIVSYAFEDGKVVDIKGCSFLDFVDDRISGYRVYVDTSRLA